MHYNESNLEKLTARLISKKMESRLTKPTCQCEHKLTFKLHGYIDADDSQKGGIRQGIDYADLQTLRIVKEKIHVLHKPVSVAVYQDNDDDNNKTENAC